MDVNSSDDEIIDLPGKFIEIAPFNPSDIDYSRPPNTGEEFLQRVIVESRRTKSKTIQIERNQPVGETTMVVDPSCEDDDPTKHPTAEWCAEQVHVFEALRMKADQYYNEELALPKEQRIQKIHFLQVESEESCQQLISSNQPTQSFMRTLGQTALDAILDHLRDWVTSGKSNLQQLGRWLYAVMVYLHSPLLPDMHSNLRSLAKHCRSLRSQMDVSDTEGLASVNLFITLIGVCFQQSDLIDPVHNSL